MKQAIAGAMLGELAKRGWGQGQSVNAQGNICASKAFDLATAALDRWSAVVVDAWAGLNKTASALYPERKPEDSGWDLIDFNDHPATTLEDLQLVIKHWATGQ